MPRPDATTQRRVERILTILGVLVGAFLLYAGFVAFSAPSQTATAPDLPNPMGGPAREAPGSASGTLELAGLRVEDAVVEMGDVALDVTWVPGWEVSNPTDEATTLSIGQPRVLEGCCPGPVYVDGELVGPDAEVTVAPGERRLVQFPLQMHAGMDGPHHLAVPLSVAGQVDAVHVTGNFTAAAPA